MDIATKKQVLKQHIENIHEDDYVEFQTIWMKPAGGTEFIKQVSIHISKDVEVELDEPE